MAAADGKVQASAIAYRITCSSVHGIGAKSASMRNLDVAFFRRDKTRSNTVRCTGQCVAKLYLDMCRAIVKAARSDVRICGREPRFRSITPVD